MFDPSPFFLKFNVYDLLLSLKILRFMFYVSLCRCINGSTLLHTACYYGHLPAIRELLAQRVDVNLRDYKGATPLHRAKDKVIMEVCMVSFHFLYFPFYPLHFFFSCRLQKCLLLASELGWQVDRSLYQESTYWHKNFHHELFNSSIQ